MEATPLSIRHWLLICMTTGSCTLMGALLWRGLAGLLVFPALPVLSFMHLAFVGVLLLVNAFAVYLLMWLRLLVARLFWLRVWTIATPLVLSSTIHLPLQPAFSLPVVWVTTILFALWGYYRCFYPLFGVETGLHTSRFAKRHELAVLEDMTLELAELFGLTLSALLRKRSH